MTWLEVCVDDAAGLAAAVAGGADRIELCSALEMGGLTPSPGLMALAGRAGIPVRAMVRPRAGDFVFSQSEVDSMLWDIEAIRSAGLAGVVIGANLSNGRLDVTVLERLLAASAGLETTLHRAIDLVPDLAEAVEEAVALGFDTILTSGRMRFAMDGVADIALAYETAAGRLTIMAGSGISPDNAPEMLRRVPLKWLHASCSGAAPAPSDVAVEFGFAGPSRKVTNAAKVMALKSVLA